MLLDVQNLRLNIAGKTILDDVSFKIDSTGYIAIIGPNGAGKSTLLKSIIGVLVPDSGVTITPNGVNLFDYFSYVPQNLSVMRGYDGWDLLDCFLYPKRLRDREDSNILEVLNSFEVMEFMERDLTTLSGGELQKIYLACSLAPRPKVLLLDEALSSMDPHIQEEVIQILKKFQKETHTTILHVSHQVNNAIHVSDRILAMKFGKVFYQGDTENFKEENLEASLIISFIVSLTQKQEDR